MGPHDLVIVVEAPNDEAFNRFMLETGSQGNIRSLSMRAYSSEEYTKMVGG